MSSFEIQSPFKPQGDQPQAIKEICQGFLKEDLKDQVLMGVTGSGKTFTMANVIEKLQRPTLIMAHNKTLAAQLYSEFKHIFPKNSVEYFVSFYDYYQPEAFIPSTGTFIEKDSSVNEEIDKVRHRATKSLFERKDAIIVSSVSCIYGLGSPETYLKMRMHLKTGQKINRKQFLLKLIEMNYNRNDEDFHRGTFRVRADNVDLIPSYEHEEALRIVFFGNEIENIYTIDAIRGTKKEKLKDCFIYPGSHYVVDLDAKRKAVITIQEELHERLVQLKSLGKMEEALRLETRTLHDIEMMEEMGFCSGIENYSRHLSGRQKGEAPPTLIEFFPKDWLLIVDESHVTIPQVGAMYKGDFARKTNLVEHGFRLPSALDNRPLKFSEFEETHKKVLYVSATPGKYEMAKCQGRIVEQIIRPTGLLDPTIEIRPVSSQVQDLHKEIKKIVKKGERVLATTLTKRMAEDLSSYLRTQHVKVRYLHSDIDTLERVEILRDLRAGVFDVLVGINLLREGLDLPEVSLVAILDADKEGFLRSRTSFIQTFGRAARNVNGHVILYADRITNSMQQAIEETDRRREIQKEYNDKMGITPQTIARAPQVSVVQEKGEDNEDFYRELASGQGDYLLDKAISDETFKKLDYKELKKKKKSLEVAMKQAASDLDFEQAAKHRDHLLKLRELELTWKSQNKTAHFLKND